MLQPKTPQLKMDLNKELMMDGIVLNFDKQEQKGIIKCDQGKRYSFSLSDWKSDREPKNGDKVDFVNNDDEANEIYLTESSNFSVDLAKIKVDSDKVSAALNSEHAKKIAEAFQNGPQNKLGVIAATVLLISLFLPVITVPFVGQGSLINGGVGKFIFVCCLVLIALFYGSFSKVFIKALSGIVIGILFLQYYDLFSELNQANSLFGGRRKSFNFFDLVQWGAFINILSCLFLLFVSFIKGRKPITA